MKKLSIFTIINLIISIGLIITIILMVNDHNRVIRDFNKNYSKIQ